VVMKEGLIQQSDSPLHTYNCPVKPIRGGIHRDAADELF